MIDRWHQPQNGRIQITLVTKPDQQNLHLYPLLECVVCEVLKDNFSANIVVGDSFNFSFRNLDVVHTVKFKKRTSRSQRKQNQKQEIKFEKERMELYNNADEFKVTESQTDESETIEFVINIDEVKVENIEDVLNEDSNGTIHTSHDKV